MSNPISRRSHQPSGTLTVIEVFADIWCPSTHAALHSINDQLAAMRRPDIRIWVRAWPLEWVNGKAMEPSAAVSRSDELRDQVVPDLFDEFDGSRFPRSTIPALALVAKGYKVGFRVGESLSLEIRDVLFEQGHDVSDPEILNRIGRYFDLAPPGPDDYATVVAEWKEGLDRGVRGSPHFFCGDAECFCPSLDITRQAHGGTREAQTGFGHLGLFVEDCLSASCEPA
jgi:hypothetical protein